MSNDKRGRVFWHDAFYSAIKLELHEYSEHLVFQDEHQLSQEALKIDVLVIKKTADVEIEKNIGRIFKGHNIIEFKSETDNLSIWDYNKAQGYAHIYSAFEKIPEKDMTVSYAVTRKPVKLYSYLRDVGGFNVNEAYPGIWYVEGAAVRTQIIENSRLAKEENIFLRNLRSRLTGMELQEVVGALQMREAMSPDEAYLRRVIEANEAKFMEVLVMGNVVFDEIVANAIRLNGMEEKILEKGIEKGREEERRKVEEEQRNIACAMLADGFAPEVVARYMQRTVEWVEGL